MTEEQYDDQCDFCGAEIKDEPYIITEPMPSRIACGRCAREMASR